MDELEEMEMYGAPIEQFGCVHCNYEGFRHGCCDDLCRGSNDAQDCDRPIACSDCNPTGEVRL